MLEQKYDAIVVGAGIEGSATAYTLAKSNYRTLLLEQFPVPHSRGSSHGQSRIIRKAYPQDFYAQMMVEGYKLWAELEAENGTSLIENTGLLVFGKAPSAGIRCTTEALSKIGSIHERLDAAGLRRRFPMLTFDDSYEGVYDTEGGVVRADKALSAYWTQFTRYGGDFLDGERVVGVRPGDIVTVTTDRGQYIAASLVLCAGPWTNKLLSPLQLTLPLTPVRITVWYWKQTDDAYAAKNFCTLIGLNELQPGDAIQKSFHADIYALPALEYPGHVKVCCHGGPPIDPDARDAPASDPSILAAMCQTMKDHFPSAEPTPSIIETCIYTLTPDENYILDTHPKWKNIVIGAGFSGHGFKMAPIVGKILCEMATYRQTSYSIQPFAIDRFKNIKCKV